MNEKLEKKIRKLLAKAGLEEEEVENIVDEINNSAAEDVEEDAPVEEQVDPTPNPEVVEEEVPVDVPPVEEVPVEEEVAPEIPPEIAEGEALPQAEEQPLEEVAPVEQPGPDPLVVELQGLLQEAQKAIEGLTARIGSLEEALQNAGVVEGGNNAEVGDETPKLTPQHDDEGENVLNDVLRQINGR